MTNYKLPITNFMAGNSFGELFRITTFGESHGKAVGVIIDGVKPNLVFSVDEIQKELDRRRPGQSNVTTARNEADRVEVLSGVFESKTLGTPICLLIRNTDQRSKDYEAIKNLFRPGHAAYTYLSKYGIHDYRGGGRSSARETAGRVASGALAKQILKQNGIEIVAYTKQVGNIIAKEIDISEIEKNIVRCADKDAAKKMEKKILRTKKEGDSIGGVVECVIKNCPVGLGEPVFDKLEAELAKAMLSIPATKGFEIGSGFAAARMKGSEHNDEYYVEKKTGRVRTRTNFSGGIQGGISDGEDIVFRVAIKPASSILKEQKTISVDKKSATIKTEGRHDPCLCPRAVPVIESMAALVIADHLMRLQMLKEENALNDVRRSIDLLDDNILILLSQRQSLVAEVAKVKNYQKKFIVDKKREANIRKRLFHHAEGAGLDKEFVEEIFHSIIKNSRAIQERFVKR
jgi:chorismate synthase